jgi:uncharacterized membrane protein
MNIEMPLISPLSRKYFNYAQEKENRKHYRAEDIRICIEYICDEIVYEFVSETDKGKWKDYDLHDKLRVSKQFMDKTVVNRLMKAKTVGNKGVHKGEEGKYTEADIEKAIETVREFSLEVFVAYFKHNGFGIATNSWMPTAFSTLPPIYRVIILKRYYVSDNSIIVIDKLSKAYTKAGLEDEANEFLKECYDKNELDMEQYRVLLNDVQLLKHNIDKLPIAKDLETAKNNFNSLLEVIPEEDRDSFICLISTILNGYSETNKSK